MAAVLGQPALPALMSTSMTCLHTSGMWWHGLAGRNGRQLGPDLRVYGSQHFFFSLPKIGKQAIYIGLSNIISSQCLVFLHYYQIQDMLHICFYLLNLKYKCVEQPWLDDCRTSYWPAIPDLPWWKYYGFEPISCLPVCLRYVNQWDQVASFV